jgi:hypothetical protein
MSACIMAMKESSRESLFASMSKRRVSVALFVNDSPATAAMRAHSFVRRCDLEAYVCFICRNYRVCFLIADEAARVSSAQIPIALAKDTFAISDSTFNKVV